MDDIINYYELFENYAFELPGDDPAVDMAKQTWGQPLEDEVYLSSQVLQSEIDEYREAEEAIRERLDKKPYNGGAIVSVNSPNEGTVLLQYLLRKELSAKRPVIFHEVNRVLLFITKRVFQFTETELLCSVQYCGILALIDSCHGDSLYEPLAVTASGKRQPFPVQVAIGDPTKYRHAWKKRWPVLISVPEDKSNPPPICFY